MKRLQNTTLNIKRVGILKVCVYKEPLCLISQKVLQRAKMAKHSAVV